MKSRLHLERLVNRVARKKILFVIVEGPSDEQALGIMLSRIFNNSEVYVHILHCDITTQNGVTTTNIISKIGGIVTEYAKRNHFSQKHFKEIIHITDTDGAFISDEYVIESAKCVDPFYSTTNIKTKDPTGIRDRNQRKSANLRRLCNSNFVWKNIPYKVFYMSCNLDHVLFDKLNTTNKEKENDSFCFAKKYKNAIPEFIDYIKNSTFSVNSEYKKSWEFVSEGLHSLERYTNFSLLLPEQFPKDEE